MSNAVKEVLAPAPDALFGRVAAILDGARGNVVRAVNTQMVQAYWLIGREIVQAVQGGEERATYGKQVIEALSTRLTQRYGQGFSPTTLQYFRKFYLAYGERNVALPRPLGVEFSTDIDHPEKSRPLGVEFSESESLHPMGGGSSESQKSDQVGTKSLQGFAPQLTWSHYRALMRVDSPAARHFYEREAVAGGWDKRTLERQIHSFYYERLLKSRQPEEMLAQGRTLPVYDGLFTAPDDNPTIGLILCTEKSETVARYSVLNDRKQIFASKYMLSLPTEEQLRQEIERERRLIESALEGGADE